jgi:hypothetical protein
MRQRLQARCWVILCGALAVGAVAPGAFGAMAASRGNAAARDNTSPTAAGPHGGVVAQRQALQQDMRRNAVALRKVVTATAHAGPTRQPFARQGPARSNTPSNARAGSTGISSSPPHLTVAHRPMLRAPAVASNGIVGTRRPPTGPVAIGGPVTNARAATSRNAGSAVLDGNALRRRF